MQIFFNIAIELVVKSHYGGKNIELAITILGDN